MKKFIIVLALVVALFSVPKQSPTDAPKPPQTAILKQAEQVSDEVKTSTEMAIYSEISEVESTTEELTEEVLIIPETQPSVRVEIAEEPTVTEPEETVECIDKGDQHSANTSRRSAVNPIPSRMIPRSRSMTDR